MEDEVLACSEAEGLLRGRESEAEPGGVGRDGLEGRWARDGAEGSQGGEERTRSEMGAGGAAS